MLCANLIKSVIYTKQYMELFFLKIHKPGLPPIRSNDRFGISCLCADTAPHSAVRPHTTQAPRRFRPAGEPVLYANCLSTGQKPCHRSPPDPDRPACLCLGASAAVTSPPRCRWSQAVRQSYGISSPCSPPQSGHSQPRRKRGPRHRESHRGPRGTRARCPSWPA